MTKSINMASMGRRAGGRGSRLGALLLPLEPRLMFDGAAVTDAAHAAADAGAKALIPVVAAPVVVREADPSKDSGKKEVAFVDTSVADYKTLEAGIKVGIAIVEIGGGADGLAQMAAWAEANSGYDAIHVFSHGTQGTVILGSATLNSASLSDAATQAELAEIGHALKAGGDVLLYGCDVAQGDAGAALVSGLASATGADIAASTDNTGDAAHGGDWVLEKTSGTIDVSRIAVDAYGELLTAPYSGTIDFGNADGGSITSDGDINYDGSVNSAAYSVGGYSLVATSDAGGTLISGNLLTFGSAAALDLYTTTATIKFSNDETFDITSLWIQNYTRVDVSGNRTYIITGYNGTDQVGTAVEISLVADNGTGTATLNFSAVTSIVITLKEIGSNGGQGHDAGMGSWYDVDDLIVSDVHATLAKPVITGLTSGTDTGSSQADKITSSTAPTVIGTGISGDTVKLYDTDGTTLLGSATVDGSGNWSIASSTLSEGTHTLKVTQTDGVSTSAAATVSVTIDTTAPTVSGVTSSTANGSYKVGDVISVQVNFSESVTVTGTPQLTLETGTTDRTVDYTSGSGTSSLTFTYTVQAGDTTADLDYISTAALALNGGTIKDAAGNNATLTLASPGVANSLGNAKAIVIDGVAPTVSGVTSSTADGSYKVGDTISVQVNFSESVTVTGTPQLTLETGTTDRTVDYASGSGTNSLTFTYTVQAGDTTADLDYISTGALALNGGTIKDAAGNDATLTLASPGAANSLGNAKAIVVDGVVPTVSAVTSSTADGSYKVGDTISVQVDFSENVTVTGTPQLTLETGTTDRTINYASGSGTSSLTFTYTVQAGDTTADLDYISTGALALNGGTIKDAAGNDATLTLASPGAANSLGNAKAIVIDGVVPTVSGVTSSTANGSYKVGDTISVQVNFSESVTVTGTPQLTLETGTTDRTVDYTSGSGSSSLTFTYTVQAGDTTADLDYISTSALVLNGGSIKDAVGNDATLTLASPGAANSLGNAKAIVIDTTAPGTPATPTMATASDHGSSNSDGTTNLTTPVINGTGVEANATVTLYDTDGTTVLGTTTADGSGNWSITSSALSAGDHTLKAKATDAAGNSSSLSSGLAVTIDTAAPTDVGLSNSIVALTAGSVAGTLSATDATSGDTFTYSLPGGVGDNGVFSISGTSLQVGTGQTLTDGQTYSVTVRVTDKAGNTFDKAFTITAADLPAVSSINRVSAQDTRGSGGLDYTVTFSKTVDNVDAGDFTVTKGAGVTGTAVISVTAGANGSSTYTVHVAGLSGDGTVRLDLNASGTGITASTGGAAIGGGYASGQNYTLDNTAATVSGVTSSTANGSYKVGDTISVQVNFSESVTVTGTPQLTLETGTTDRTIDYASGSGTNSLTFTYTVQAGDTTADLDYISTSALVLNGGSIKDAVGNDATLTLASPGAANSLGNAKAIVVDGVAPTVSGVTSSTADGSYKVGDTISVQVDFSENVTVTGTPQLTLETGTTDRTVNYASGSGTSSLTFTYTVQAGDTTADLDYISTGALALNGGTIKDAAGNDATLTLASPGVANSLGNAKAIVVDGVAPTVSGVTSSTANGSYKVGDTISVQVNFSESVTVTGTPQLTLETGTTDRTVNYASGSGTSSLTFTYTVQAGDTTADLDYISTGALALNGGTIKDAVGNDATLTLASPGAANSLGNAKAIVVDGVVPTVSAVTSSTANGSYKVGDTISVQVNFSENVTVTGTPQLTLETGTTDRTINYASGSGSSSLTFTYTVQAGDTTADLDYISTSALVLNGGSIKDAVGNDATLTLASPGAANSLGNAKAIVVDGVAPTVSGVTSSTANGSYKVGDTISVQVNFSESVTVTGTPQLTLETGTTDRTVDYTSGSGTNSLTFTYTVQAGDTTADLDYVSTGALVLNGGSIKDAVGNDATLTLTSPGAANSLGNAKAIVIDTTAATVTSVSVPADKTYGIGQNMDFTVNFDEAVTVDTTGGTPRIAVTLNIGGTVYADYVSGSGSSALVFRLLPQRDNDDNDGVTVGALGLNGGTIKDAAGNNATLTLNGVASTTAVQVDGKAPDAPTLTVPATAASSTSVTVNGTAEANSTVKVYDGAILLGETTANESGVWKYNATLVAGSNKLTAKAVDAVGNVSEVSSETEVVVTLPTTNNTTVTTVITATTVVTGGDSGGGESGSSGLRTIIRDTGAGTGTGFGLGAGAGLGAGTGLGIGATGGSPTTGDGGRVAIIPAVLTAPTAGAFQVAVAARPPGGGDALVVNAPMRDMAVAIGSSLSVTIPAEAFAHTRADATVTLAASQVSGAALPSWMVFDAKTGTFKGTPPPGFRGEVTVKVVARDNQGREAVQTFKIRVGEAGPGGVAPGEGGQGQGQGGQRSGDLGLPGKLAHAVGRPSLTEQLRNLSRDGHKADGTALIALLQGKGRAA
ncbi:DUF4347 domain-containing protein [Magnetospirillum sp. 15-1]|uniref:DUF4347 domain-containing protein n=1 Tax=Magnetospirillum sp. 15-1 TaxID=1979370 RepID=UPI0011428B41|nr:DUF4347 domain-containing protein [Magnetospirillum sp. 15-1]